MLPFLILNKETITLLIAIIGFVLSSGQLIYTIYLKRLNLHIDIQTIEYAPLEDFDKSGCVKKDGYIFLCTIVNKSSSPLVITKIFVYDTNGKKYPCRLRHIWIGENYYPKFERTDIPCTERKLTANFPICLESTCAIIEAIKFDLPKDAIISCDGKVTFEVSTIKKHKLYSLQCPPICQSSLSV